MMRRILCGLVLIAAVAPLSEAIFKQAVKSGGGTAATNQVAARWYHRARHGQLHRRSTPAGRSIPHTVLPVSVRSLG